MDNRLNRTGRLILYTNTSKYVNISHFNPSTWRKKTPRDPRWFSVLNHVGPENYKHFGLLKRNVRVI